MIKLLRPKKNNYHLYSPHSAPITNGILRNSKWSADTSYNLKNEERRVTFSIRRSQTQMNMDDIRESMKYFGPERSSSRSINPQSARQDHRRKRMNQGNTKHRERNGQRGRKINFSTRENDDITPSPECMRDESTSMIDTANTTCVNEEIRLRTRLSRLLDEKIETKMRRNSQEDESESESSIEEADQQVPVVYKPFSKKAKATIQNDMPGISLHPNSSSGPRRRLSLLVEKKIEAKMRRNSQEDDSDGDMECTEEAGYELSAVHKPHSKRNEAKQHNAGSAEKVGSANQEKPNYNGTDGQRSRLSLLVDKKIVAKARRISQGEGTIE